MLARLLLFLLVISLNACGPSSQTRPDNSAELEQDAIQFMQTGEYELAAEEYLKLAEKNKSYRPLFQLKAAAAYFEAENVGTAQSLLDKIKTTSDQHQLKLQKSILEAKIALSQNQPDRALEILNFTPKTDVSDSLLYNFHGIRADAFSINLDSLAAIIERHQQFQFIDAIPIDDELDYRMWQDLLALDAEILQELQLQSQIDLVAWSELASIQLGGAQGSIEEALNLWSLNYPGHPALDRIVPEILEAATQYSSPPEHIALLLPFNGQLQQASMAIREGFIANWYSDDNKPQLSVFNADSLNILDAYQNAISAGADFIVGPLEKTAITKLLEQGQPQTRVLMLNSYDGDFDALPAEQTKPGKGLFQLGLSPEIEARETAERAYGNNLERSVVIYPINSWGRRSSNAFKQHFESLGGVVLKEVGFDETESDLSKPVKELLGIDQSKARAKALQAHLGRKIHSEERRRQDISFIYLLAKLNHARQLMPHIFFQRADDIPVLASSLIHAGNTNPERDKDLNEVSFPDIPWLLNPNSEIIRVRSTLEEHGKLGLANSQRLYALGHDAYELLKNLPELVSQPNYTIDGATGKLFLGEQGEVLRKMTWAQFVDGRPQRLYDQN